MWRTVTDTKFLIGVAVGYLALPYATRMARSFVERMKPATQTQTTA